MGMRKMRTASPEKFQEYLDELEEPSRDGVMARIEASRSLEMMSCLVIISNALCTAISTDWEMRNLGDTIPHFVKIIELGFLAFYVMELMLRLHVHRCYFFVNLDYRWNIFDFLLVLISLGDSAVTMLFSREAGSNVTFMRAVRLIKLTKIFRTLRVLKVFEDLAQMLLGFARSMMSLFWCFVMLSFILYMFGLIILQGMTQFLLEDLKLSDITSRDDVLRAFGSLPDTMLTLYVCATGGDDWKVYYNIVEKAGVFYAAAFLFFTFFFTFAVFNILTGIFVEKAMAAAQPERDQKILYQRKQIVKDTQTLKILMGEMKKDTNGKMTSDEFVSFLMNEDVCALFSCVGLRLNDAKMFFDMLIALEGSDEVSINTFIEGCLAMKGSATSLDMQRQLFEMQFMFAYLRRFEDNCMNRFDELTYRVRDEFQEVSVLHQEVSEKLNSDCKEERTPEESFLYEERAIRVARSIWVAEADQQRAKLAEVWSNVKQELHAEADRQHAKLEEVWNQVKQEICMIQQVIKHPREDESLRGSLSVNAASCDDKPGLKRQRVMDNTDADNGRSDWLPSVHPRAFSRERNEDFLDTGIDVQSNNSVLDSSNLEAMSRQVAELEHNAFAALQASFSRACYAAPVRNPLMI